MTSSTRLLTLNLLPPEKLFCDFNYWSSLFSQDIELICDKGHGIALNKLPSDIYDKLFPYLLIALSDYKISNFKTLSGIGIDNLLNLWFDKYLLNKDGYFELLHPYKPLN